MNIFIRTLAVFVLTAWVGAANATLITFDFPATGERDLTSKSFSSGGTTLLVDNPRGNTTFGDNTFAMILGGLFIDGGLAPTLDFTFSEDVRLVSYILGNNDAGETFDLTQGGLQSLGQSLNTVGSFAFSNTGNTFLANQAIVLTHSNHNGEGFSFSSITVETIPVPATLVLFGLGLVGLGWSRSKKSY